MRPLLWVLPLSALLASCLGGRLFSGRDLIWGAAELAFSAPELEEKRKRCAEIRAVEVPLQEELAFGGAVAVTWVHKAGGLMLDGDGPGTRMHRYLNRVGKNLAMQSDRPLIPWSFGALQSDAFNALATPAGYVFVTRGLLAEVENEAQLAGVLAHEIAHISQKHALASYRKVKGNECEAAVDAMAMGKLLGPAIRRWDSYLRRSTLGLVDLGDVDNLALLTQLTQATIRDYEGHGYASDQEHEADQLAIALLVGAGYDPGEYIRFLQKAPEQEAAFPHHPPVAERQARMRAYVAALKTDPTFLASHDHPFTRYAKVPLKRELAPARAPRKTAADAP